MQENQKDHTIIRDGRKFTDCADTEIRPDSDPSGAFFGRMKGVTKKDSTSYKQRCKKTKTPQKKKLNGFYPIDDLFKTDEAEQ